MRDEMLDGVVSSRRLARVRLEREEVSDGAVDVRRRLATLYLWAGEWDGRCSGSFSRCVIRNDASGRLDDTRREHGSSANVDLRTT